MEIQGIFEAFEKMKIIVVGDIMLDVYLKGEVERISPEAPIPIVRILSKEIRAGGAANVAANCQSLGAKVTLASIVGEDEPGRQLTNLLKKEEISTSLILSSQQRPTTTKTRIISRNQQIIRFDEENSSDITMDLEHRFIDAVLKHLQIDKPNVVIFEDYNKGLLKENIITQIIRHCQHLHIPIAVDPKKKNFLCYKGVTVFKPNLKEVTEGLNLAETPITTETLKFAHQQLREKLNHQISFITLSERGVFYGQDDHVEILPSHRRNIADVSGAGDTVIAVAAMVYAETHNARQMALWANLAGGLVCEEVGVVKIDKQKFQAEIEKYFYQNH